MSETIVLDPSEEAPDRVEVDLTPFIGQAGPDWGDASVEAKRAKGSVGSRVIDFDVPNRMAQIPLVVTGRAGVSFDELRSILQQKVALWQREGGWVKRETSIGPVFARVETAALKLGGGTAQAMLEVDADAVLQLELSPEWLGEWVEEPENGGDGVDGTGEVIRLLEPDRGDQPAPIEITVEDVDSVSRRGIVWCLRSRHYSSDATAALAYEAEVLTPLDTATVATVSGASGGGSNNVVQHASLATGWTPVLSTDINNVGPMTHAGSYRAWARVRTTSTTAVRVRLAWETGDTVNPHTNPSATVPASGEFYRLDLGIVALTYPRLTGQAWHGTVQAAGENGGENLSVDRIWFQALDDFAGEVVAPLAVAGPAAYSARDEFNQSAGALTGKTAPVGGSWAGAGDSDDFSVVSPAATANRTATSDSDTQTGRYAISGATGFAGQVVQVDVRASEPGQGYSGVIARYTDTNNWFRALISPSSPGPAVLIGTRVAGTVTNFVAGTTDRVRVTEGHWYTIRAFVGADGTWAVWVFQRGAAPGSPAWVGRDLALAASGALESGKPGFYDYNGSNPNTREYDNFAAWSPDIDAAIHADHAAYIATDGAVRDDATGDGYGPVHARHDLPRLPAPGAEGRPSELLVMATPSDLERVPDSDTAAEINVKVRWRPSYLYVPDAGQGS